MHANMSVCAQSQGDWGTQFGMLIQHIAETREGGLGSDALDEDVADLEVFYKASKQHFDTDPAFKLRAQQAVTKLQAGDPDFLDVSCTAAYVPCCCSCTCIIHFPSAQGVNLSQIACLMLRMHTLAVPGR